MYGEVKGAGSDEWDTAAPRSGYMALRRHRWH